MKKNSIIFFLLIFCISSCKVINKVIDYPNGRPFVYESNIKLKNEQKADRERIGKDLNNYLDDSLRVKKVKKLFFITRRRNPPVFDSIYIGNSIQFVKSYLYSLGYFHAKDTFTVEKKTEGDQQRCIVNIEINPGKSFLIDSLAFNIKDTLLKKTILADAENTLLKKGIPYSKKLIADELDRILQQARVNGYYKISKDVLIAQVDTTDLSLLETSLDPFEQIKKLAEAEKRKESPSIHITIIQREGTDSTKLKQYVNGNIYFHPEIELKDQPDSILAHFPQNKMDSINHIYIIGTKGLFDKNIFNKHTYIRPNRLYNDLTFFRTLNNYNQMGAWQQIDFKSIPYIDSIRLQTNKDSAFRIAHHFFMIPAKKYSFNVDLEGSRNTGDIVSVGNLLGLSTSLSLTNRNVWHKVIQANTSIRAGIELNLAKSEQVLQTIQFSASHNYSFPRFVLPFSISKEYRLDYSRSLLNFSATYTNRRDFYVLQNILLGWSYEWKNKNRTWIYRPLNIELYRVEPLKGLQDAIQKSPFLGYAFNDGNVVAQFLSVTQTFGNAKRNSSLKLNVEESGSLIGLIKGLQSNIFRYVKTDIEYKWLLQKHSNAWAFRAFMGFGYNYGNDPNIGTTLPFFKQYIAGGPNSMRAWPLRQLGLGSSIKNDTASQFKDRFGDMQLEINMEYRFKIMKIAGVDLNGGWFVDIGNVWNVAKDPTNPGSEFRFKNLYQDLAIGSGIGLRLDFKYFLLRGDFGFRLKDPARQKNNGWIENVEFKSVDAAGNLRSNTAFQIGIGLPF